MRRRTLFLALLMVVPTAGCSEAGDSSSSETAAVEQLIDVHDQAWLDNDPEAVGALFTDDGVFRDLTGGETAGREAIVRYAETHVELIPDSRRTGPIEAREDGTFAYPSLLVVSGVRSGTYTGVTVIAIENGLLALYDVSQLTRKANS